MWSLPTDYITVAAILFPRQQSVDICSCDSPELIPGARSKFLGGNQFSCQLMLHANNHIVGEMMRKFFTSTSTSNEKKKWKKAQTDCSLRHVPRSFLCQTGQEEDAGVRGHRARPSFRDPDTRPDIGVLQWVSGSWTGVTLQIQHVIFMCWHSFSKITWNVLCVCVCVPLQRRMNVPSTCTSP